jgi:mono/diheme cytochrome c family protein
MLRLGFRVSQLATMTVVTIAGHQGGNLTHGTNYLTKNAPLFVKQLIEESPEPAGEPAESGAFAASAGERFFAERVRPIFDTKCASCHGAEKQKGEYRLDEKAVAFKGGESGKTAIKPGEALQSHLVDLVLLPPDDDDVMPPKGKRALTSDEIMILIRWVQQGAPFPEVAHVTPADTAEK